MKLTDNEMKMVLVIFNELQKMPYEKLNTFLGSLTIEEMYHFNEKYNEWYQREVCGKVYSEEFGWYNQGENDF